MANGIFSKTRKSPPWERTSLNIEKETRIGFNYELPEIEFYEIA